MTVAAPARSRRALTLAALGYGALVAVLLAVAFGEVVDMLAKRAAVAEAQDLLDRLEGRRPPRPGAAGAEERGSPFLEGATVTVAGAALAERVAAAADAAGGHLVSSSVELGASPLGPGFVAVSATIDIGQEDLQNLLYDIEAGQPFLFVDPLVVQAQGQGAALGQLDTEGTEGRMQGEGSEGRGQDGRVQVTLTVHGRWRGAR